MKLTLNQNGSGKLQIEILKAICGDIENKTLIDLCCGSAPQTGLMNFKEKTFVDCVDRPLVGGGKLIVKNVIEYLENYSGPSFDISISTDTIEHFRDKDANNFLDLAKQVSKKQVWFTPLGEYCMTTDPNDNNPDSHKSEWTPEKLDKMNPRYWAYVVFPNWHPTLSENGLGAFFFWHCEYIKEDFARVSNELKHLI